MNRVSKLVVMLCFGCSCHVLHAQELKPTVLYMSMPEVSQIAKDVHSGKVKPGSDNELVYTIADSMSTDNNVSRPFYIFLVSKMLQYSTDEKLKHRLGEYCRHIMQNKPDPVVELLFSRSVKPEYKTAWAKMIAANIAATCDTELTPCFKTARVLSLEMSKTENKDKVEAIFNQVRANLNLQRH